MRSISKLKDEARRYEQREEWDRAIQVYLQVLQSDEASESDIEPLYNRIGDLSVRLGRPHDAVRYYEMAADRYAETGLYNNAIALCNKALRYDARNLSVLRKLGQYSASQGFITDARRYFLEYAEHQFRAGHTDDALAALEDFANLSDDAEICELLGRKLLAHGRSEDAAHALRRAWQMRVAAGEQAEAAALRNEILSIDPQAFSGTAEPSANAAPAQPSSPVRDDSLPLIHPFGSDPRDAAPDKAAGAGHDHGDIAPSRAADADPEHRGAKPSEPAGTSPKQGDPESDDLAFLDDDPFDYGPMAGLEADAATQAEEEPPPLPLIEPEADDAIEFEAFDDPPPVPEPEEEPAPTIDPVEGLETTSLDFSAVSDLGVDDDGLVIDHDDPFDLPTLEDPEEDEATEVELPPAPQERKPVAADDASIDDLVAASFDVPALESGEAADAERAGPTGPGDDDPLPVFDLPSLPSLGGSDLKFTDDALLDIGPIFEIETTGEPEPDGVAAETVPEDVVVPPQAEESESSPPDPDIRDWFRALTSPAEPEAAAGAEASSPPADSGAEPSLPADAPSAGPTDADAFDFDFLSLAPGADRLEDEIEGILDSAHELEQDLPGLEYHPEHGESRAEAETPETPGVNDFDRSGFGPDAIVAESVRETPVGNTPMSRPTGDAVSLPPLAPVPASDAEPLSSEIDRPSASVAPASRPADEPDALQDVPPATEPSVSMPSAPEAELPAVSGAKPGPVPADSGSMASDAEPPLTAGTDSDVGATAAEPSPAHTRSPEDVEPSAIPDREVSVEDTSEYVDLASMLDDRDAPTTRFRVQETTPTGDEDRDFAELLNQFKAKVSENLPPEEAAAHYDLGIAFKEMGLIDEAIGEFQVALRTGHMRLKVYEELGHCFLHKEQHNIAVKVLQRALEMKYEDEVELLGVYYHLGRAFEAMGRTDDARDAYERVLGMDYGFQDAADRLARL